MAEMDGVVYTIDNANIVINGWLLAKITCSHQCTFVMVDSRIVDEIDEQVEMKSIIFESGCIVLASDAAR